MLIEIGKVLQEFFVELKDPLSISSPKLIIGDIKAETYVSQLDSANYSCHICYIHKADLNSFIFGIRSILRDWKNPIDNSDSRSFGINDLYGIQNYLNSDYVYYILFANILAIFIFFREFNSF